MVGFIAVNFVICYKNQMFTPINLVLVIGVIFEIYIRLVLAAEYYSQ